MERNKNECIIHAFHRSNKPFELHRVIEVYRLLERFDYLFFAIRRQPLLVYTINVYERVCYHSGRNKVEGH